MLQIRHLNAFDISYLVGSNYPIHISLLVNNYPRETQFITLAIDNAKTLADVLHKTSDQTSMFLLPQQGKPYEVIWNSSLMVNFEHSCCKKYSFKLHRIIAVRLAIVLRSAVLEYCQYYL